MVERIPTGPCPPKYNCFIDNNGMFTINLSNKTFEDGVSYYINISNPTVVQTNQMTSQLFDDMRWRFTFIGMKKDWT